MMNHLGGVVFLTVIAGRKQKSALLDALAEMGGRLVNIVYGRGTVDASYLKCILGMVPEEEKAVITCLLPGEKTDAVMEMLVKKFRFDKPNTGIAFTIAVEKLSV